MTIRKKIKALVFMLTALALMVGMAATVAITGRDNTVFADDAAASEFKIAVLSDTHYYPSIYMDNNEDFAAMLASSRNLIMESDGILTAALAAIKADAPDVLLITGDLTAHGERQGHAELAAKLKAFETDTGIKVYVINGNNDINNNNTSDNPVMNRAASYADGEISSETSITAEGFKELYAELGYSEATATYIPAEDTVKSGTLSYVVKPASGYTIIAVDTAKYTSDLTDSSKNLAEMGGAMSDDLLAWVTTQAKTAANNGDTVLVFQHHGVTSGMGEESMLSSIGMENSDRIAKAYTEANIELVFSSHMQANDISAYTVELSNGEELKLYDVQNASITSYPMSYRTVGFAKASKATKEADIKTKHLTSFKFNDVLNGGAEKNIDDAVKYSKENTLLTTSNIHPIVDDIVHQFVDALVTEGGISTLLEDTEDTITGKVTPNPIKERLRKAFSEMLSTALPEPIDIMGQGIATASFKADRIVISISLRAINTLINDFVETLGDDVKLPDQITGLLTMLNIAVEMGVITSLDLYIDADSLMAYFEDILLSAEDAYLTDYTYLSGKVYTMIDAFMTCKLDEIMTFGIRPKESNGNILNMIYQSFQMGDEQSNASVDTFLNLFKENVTAVDAMVTYVYSPIVADILLEVMQNDNIEGDFTKIFAPDSNTMALSVINMIPTLLESFGGGTGGLPGGIGGLDEFNLDTILRVIGGMETISGAFLDGVVSDETRESLRATIYESFSAMAYDTNYSEDKNTKVVLFGTSKNPDKSDGCSNCGCGTIDITTFTMIGGLLVLCSLAILFVGKRRKVKN